MLSSAERVKYWEARDTEEEFLVDVQGEKALSFVKKLNHEAIEYLKDSIDDNIEGSALYKQILSILNSKEKIPYVSFIDGFLYNFWQDENHTRGILRRTTLDSYLQRNNGIDSSQWELVLDIDELSKTENASWVYKGYTTLDKSGLHNSTSEQLCLLKLSVGGSDAVVVREFDLTNKRFLSAEDNAFVTKEAKTFVSYQSRDVMLIATKLPSNDTTSTENKNEVTSSGYPRKVRLWRRGQALEDAEVVFEGNNEDVLVHAYHTIHNGFEMEFVSQAKTFYTSTKYLKCFNTTNTSTSSDNTGYLSGFTLLSLIPADAELSTFQDQLLVSLRSAWRGFEPGALLAVSAEALLSACAANNNKTDNDGKDSDYPLELTALFTPSSTSSLDSFTVLKDYLIIHALENVKSRATFWKYSDRWTLMSEEAAGRIRGASFTAFDSDTSNDYWFSTSSFTQPSAMYLLSADEGANALNAVHDHTTAAIKSLPKLFNEDHTLIEQQFFATSADGTQVPYFIVHPAGHDFTADGPLPLLLYGYGGFEISLSPSYLSVMGPTWLSSNKACYAVANIRGGGEFGPTWHQAALRENRVKAYDDFIAVAEDLINNKHFTSKEQLGIRGGSNGGLLVSNMLVRRPDLFQAIVCQVPLVDMKKFNKLLAGASWMAEYGDPDKPEDWEFLKNYSAYHNIDISGQHPTNNTLDHYPALLTTTSTKDDRVHPYHARSLVHRLLRRAIDIHGSGGADMDVADVYLNEHIHANSTRGKVLYYENIEGGHGGAADNKQQAFMQTLMMQFLNKMLVNK